MASVGRPGPDAADRPGRQSAGSPLRSCSVGTGDERDVVRRGYDALSYFYRSDDAVDGEYAPWLADMHRRLPPAATILDLGCGCGVPVARFLTQAGHRVTGVDISEVQIVRARRLVPTGRFLRADATRLTLPPASFDAVICRYALIHIPMADQLPLLYKIATWLRPAAGCWPQPATRHGPAPRTTGSAARRPCGGATPTPPPIGAGCSRQDWRSARRSSCRRATAATPSSGRSGHRSAEVSGLDGSA